MLKRSVLLTILSLLILSMIGGGAVLALETAGDSQDSSAQEISFNTSSQVQDSSGNPYAQIYEAVAPSVVSIRVIVRNEAASAFGSEFTAASGSGFIIDAQGHIVTNAHVVDGAVEIEVEFFDGVLTHASVTGSDPESDIAVIKADLPDDYRAGLQPVTFADSSNVFVGQSVAAIGSPFSQEWTMTTGIISAVGRAVDSLGDFLIGGVLQTDAAINPGNSGGPLLDMNGNVIGVNSQILSTVRSNSGVGFAVPSNLVQRVAAEIIRDGAVSYSFIGIRGGDLSLSEIEVLDLPLGTRGVLVVALEPGAPAARAGLQAPSGSRRVSGVEVPTEYDIITGIDGREIRDFADLVSYLSAQTLPGDTVTLAVLRNGTETIEIDVTLSDRP